MSTQSRRWWWVAVLALAILALGACRVKLPTAVPREAIPATAASTPIPTAAPSLEAAPTATAEAAPSPTAAPPTQQPSPQPSPLPPTTTPLAATELPPAATPPSVPATPLPVVDVGIDFLRANVEIANPGDTVTLEWLWHGDVVGTLYHLLPTGQLSEPSWHVPPQGSLEIPVAPEARNAVSYVLFLTDEQAGLVAQQTVRIALTCPDWWFFSPAPTICPAGPALEGLGAEQHFERGVMLWSEAEDRIYVLFDSGVTRWTAFADAWEEGQPVSDPAISPPEGLYQPVRGFGLVWRNEPGLRERLGWAVDQEQGYPMKIQRTSDYRYADLYISAFISGVWKLGPNGGQWERLP